MAKFPRRSAAAPGDDLPPRPNAKPKAPNAIVAAATRLNRRVRNANGSYGAAPIKIVQSEWQVEAWRQYDLTPELHFGVQWIANQVGRCRLTLCPVDAAGVIGPPTDDASVLALVQGLLGNPGLQKEILTNATINLTVAGDLYVVAEPDPDGAYTEWCALSTREINIGLDDKIWISDREQIGAAKRQIDTDVAITTRIHRPHANDWCQADSPTRPALPVLRELEELSKLFFSAANSRLGGPGILALPSEMSFPSPTQDVADPSGDDFMDAFSEATLAAIEDNSNPASQVPIIVRAPKDALGGIQWIVNPRGDVPTPLNDLRERAIARLAIALDLDASSLLGTPSANHWGEWAAEEQSIKFHIEPIMLLICNALTEVFLEAMLTAAGLDPAVWTFWYDASDLIQRPDRAVDAKDLYDRGELSGAALRRETGFTELDAPEGNELLARTIMKLIAAAPTFADTILPHVLEVFGLDKIVSEEDLTPVPVDGTPAQDPAPAPNKDPKAIPVQPKPAQTKPRADGKSPEAN